MARNAAWFRREPARAGASYDQSPERAPAEVSRGVAPADVSRGVFDTAAMLALQQSAGNTAVSAMLARVPITSKAPALQEDSAEALHAASTDELLDVFLMSDDVDFSVVGDGAIISRNWLLGEEGDELVRAAIEQRLAAMNRQELPAFLNKIDQRPGGVERKFWLQIMAHDLPQYSKDDFLALTNEVNTRIDLADRKTRAWLASLATSYRRAWKAHKDVLIAQDKQNLFAEELKRLPLNFLLGAALAFVPGGTGGLIGARMRTAGSGDFMVDGVKDLWKWGLRSTGQAGIAGGVQLFTGSKALAPYPLDPEDWEGKETQRVTAELAVATKTLLDWQEKARLRDPSLSLNFNPIEAMNAALTVSDEGGRRYKAADLEPVDHDTTATQFERGFWTKWLELYGYQLEVFRVPKGATHYVLVRNVGSIVQGHCEKLGLDVEKYARLAKARIDAQFPGGKPRGGYYQ
jgi:hypothetical protein